MIKKVMLLASALMLGACSLSCSDRFEKANNHVLDTARSVYEIRSLGEVTADNAYKYQLQIEKAYESTQNGSVLCESDEVAAVENFDRADNILDSIDKMLELTEIEGK